jgi:CMP-N-acetylneuraminic acid synthetase
MGTSVKMIERHYSHLEVFEAIEQLRGNETRKMISASSTVDEIYQSSIEKKKAGQDVRKVQANKRK